MLDFATSMIYFSWASLEILYGVEIGDRCRCRKINAHKSKNIRIIEKEHKRSKKGTQVHVYKHINNEINYRKVEKQKGKHLASHPLEKCQ